MDKSTLINEISNNIKINGRREIGAPILSRILNLIVESSINESDTIAKSLFVSVTGDDLKAIKGSPARPFKTLKSAQGAAIAGDTIFVFPGVYTDFNLGKNLVNWHFFKGAVVQPVDPRAKPIFTDALAGPLVFSITGLGRLINLGVHDNDSSSIEARQNNTFITVEAEVVSSMEVWNVSNAKMIFRNCEFTQETAIYGAGGAEFYNCFFNNSVQYWALYANISNPANTNNYIKCVNCRFLTKTAFPPGYSGGEIPGLNLEASNILFQNGAWATNSRAKGKVYLQNCTFESFQHNILFNILTENSDVTLIMKDCLLKSTDVSKFSIRHVKTHYNNNPNVKFCIYNTFATNSPGGTQPIEPRMGTIIIDSNVDFLTNI